MKPMLFNTEMVRATLDNRKTVTRRVVKPQPAKWQRIERSKDKVNFAYVSACEIREVRPPYRPGDILYVRETWTHTCIHCKHYPGMFFCPPDCGTCPEFVYKADGISLDGWPDKRWRPSIHMPREAARIFLRVTDVRVEQLQSIGPEQLRKEGFFLLFTPSECKRMFDRFGAVKNFEREREKFAALWNSTIKKSDLVPYGWDANPWVWVIEFERISREGVENHAV